MRHIKCILFFLLIFGTWNLHAQDNTMERLAAERFNHFNVVFYSFLNNISYLEEDANVVFSNDELDEFTAYYYGDIQSFETKVKEMQTAFESMNREKAAVVTVQVCKESIQDLYTLGLLEKPKGQPCQKVYQQEYYGCIMEHIICSNGELVERMSALYDCTFSRTQDLHDCLDNGQWTIKNYQFKYETLSSWDSESSSECQGGFIDHYPLVLEFWNSYLPVGRLDSEKKYLKFKQHLTKLATKDITIHF